LNRRTLLIGSVGASAIVFNAHTVFAQTSTPAAGAFPELEIVVDERGYTIPEVISAGRRRVTVMNVGAGESHTSLCLLPEGLTKEAVLAEMQSSAASSTDGPAPDWFWKAAWVGLPDWPKPGKSVVGIVDLHPGLTLLLNPIGDQAPSLFEITGEFAAGPEPAVDATVVLSEMIITLPPGGLKSGKQRLRIENKGAVEHEFAVIPLPAGISKQQLLKLFSLPDNATPTPDQPNVEYAPIAACSILSTGGTSWIDVDIPAGHYAALCMLPDQQTGIPHGLLGMLEVFDIA